MPWLERLNEIKKKSRLTTAEISALSKVPVGTLNKIFAGVTKTPQLDTVQAIVHSLGYTLDDLDDESRRIHSDAFTDSECEYVHKYRALDKHGKKMVTFTLDEETARMEAAAREKEAEKTRMYRTRILRMPVYEADRQAELEPDTEPFRMSLQAASAGTGVYLGPDEFELISVRRGVLPRGADFGIPVSGDSMEPQFADGDILIISREHPEVGEVGVFMLDGDGYVKIRGERVLVSINEKYPPIAMDESIRSVGKVIGVLDVMNVVQG